MKKFILNIIVIIFFLLGVTEKSFFAQNNNSENLPAQITSNQLNSDAQRIAVLETKLDAAEKYNDKILNTVYWALGGLVTVLVLIVGLGWITNFRIYRSDVDNIKREIVNELENAKISLKNEMTKAAREIGESAVRNSLREIKTLQYEKLKQEAKDWARQSLYVNSLLAYSEAIPIVMDVYPEHYIPQILDPMLNILKEKEVKFNSGALAIIIKNLEVVPKEYGTDVEAIKQLISAIRAKTPKSED